MAQVCRHACALALHRTGTKWREEAGRVTARRLGAELARDVPLGSALLLASAREPLTFKRATRASRLGRVQLRIKLEVATARLRIEEAFQVDEVIATCGQLETHARKAPVR